MAIPGHVRPQLPEELDQVNLLRGMQELVEAVEQGVGLPAQRGGVGLQQEEADELEEEGVVREGEEQLHQSPAGLLICGWGLGEDRERGALAIEKESRRSIELTV